MDLQDPTAKMSKTATGDAGLIRLLDEPEVIARKFKRAVTDSESEVRYDREHKPGVSNLLEILAAIQGDRPEDVAAGYTQYGPLKSDAGEAVIELLRPIQKRATELLGDRAELASLLRKGAEKAGVVASATLEPRLSTRSASFPGDHQTGRPAHRFPGRTPPRRRREALAAQFADQMLSSAARRSLAAVPSPRISATVIGSDPAAAAIAAPIAS